VFNGVKLTIDPPVWLIDELGNGGTVIRLWNENRWIIENFFLFLNKINNISQFYEKPK
jgi:hypothetical protein